MKNGLKLKKSLAAILCVLTLFAGVGSTRATFYADTAVSVSYSFTGTNAADAGYAQGTITLSAPAGTYWLYWADDAGALRGYGEIAKLNVSSGSQSHTMYPQTAIPADAVKLAVFSSVSEPGNKGIENAAAVYDIPESKQTSYGTADRCYRFASYSDIHIDGLYSTYKYSDDHWAEALEVAAGRDVDFIITSGDHINNNNSSSGIDAAEWKIYQKILAQSDYCNPIYEAVGNHELWQNVAKGTDNFIAATGLEGSVSNSDKAYYEKTLNGDHFIFMALEGGFYPDRVEEFSNEQLDWLEGLLQKYSGDGNNIYIIEHSLFYRYGAGDDAQDEPYYDIPLSDNQASTRRFKSILETYRDTIFISGHTHIAFGEQFNYSDNNGTSAQMIHNSSVGGTRSIVNGALTRTYGVDETEGYIVDVFDDAVIFNGTNLYRNEYDPNCCYVVRTSAQAYENMTGVKVSLKKSGKSASKAITAVKTNTGQKHVSGDVNGDGSVKIGDATLIQKHLASLVTLTEAEFAAADVNFDGAVTVEDATKIQKYIACLIASLEDESRATTPTQTPEVTEQTETQTAPQETETASEKTSDPAETERVETTCAPTQSDGDFKAILNEVGDTLSLYYRYSSYDNYQALKKEYRADTALYEAGALDTAQAAVRLNELRQELLSVVDPENVDKSITVYFENNKGWSNVYAYCWSSSAKNADWPGVKAVYAGKNSGGSSIYKYTVDAGVYSYIIFNCGDNSAQTVDISLTEGNICYRPNSSSNKYTVTSYSFDESMIV